MDGAAADRLAAIVAAELQRVGAIDDALVGPVELCLLRLVGGEIFERPPKWTCIEADDRKPRFGQLACEGAAAGAGANDREIDLLVLRVLPHRHPPPDVKHIGCAPIHRPRRLRRIVSGGGRAHAPPPPTDRGG